MSLNWNGVLLILGALLVLVEVSLGGFAGFDLVLIGSSLAIGGALGLAFHSPTVGVTIASVLSLVYIAIGRRWVRDRMRGAHVASNVDALVGQRAVVTTRVSLDEPGQVKVRDEVWRAIPANGGPGPFDPGSVVTVQAVDGVTLVVR